MSMNLVRRYSKKLLFSLRNVVRDSQPKEPVRTRFAPSPTGFLHLGSLRTALYNYLLAKSTNGTFILRLEDTDQKRLAPGLEENIYDTLNWLDLNYNEGPIVGGPSSPYRQSDRTDIYLKYVNQLLDQGKAYRCFCTKSRLDTLRESAKMLKPPTTVSYDRHCLHTYLKEESDFKLQNGEEFTIRLKSPDKYPAFNDLLHGNVNLQPQININDIRYDDLVLLKSDKLPTYHLANVIDDHLMDITHVIRGEEWLPSTPKHIALYNAFGWPTPEFIHIPLLTTTEDKKLSKRSGDIDIMSLKSKGYLKEALINFCVLFGWSPKRGINESVKEIFNLKELESMFNLNQLTKGNAKVDFKKLDYFNKHYLGLYLKNDPIFFEDSVRQLVETLKYPNITENYIRNVLKEVGPALTKLKDLETAQFAYLFTNPDFETDQVSKFIEQHGKQQIISILEAIQEELPSGDDLDTIISKLSHSYNKKQIFQTLRLAISGLIPGLKLPQLVTLLGEKEIENRLKLAINYLS